MSSTAVSPTARVGRRGLTSSALAVTVGLVIGGVTSFGQLLPAVLNPLANSVSGWTIPMVALVWWARGGPTRSAITGALVFVAECLGYSLVSTLRGNVDLELTWSLIGLVIGPVLGVAIALLRGRSVRMRALASGVLGGIALADGIRGLVLLPDGWGAWSLVLMIGIVFLAATGWHLPDHRHVVLQMTVAVVVGVLFVVMIDVVLHAILLAL